MFLRQSPFEKGARVIARRGVALKENKIGGTIIATAEEMVLRDLVKRRAGSETGNVTAEAVVLLVRIDDHRHGVPANDAFDTAFDFAVAGVFRLFPRRNGIH